MNVVVGASAGLGRALTEELAARGHDLLLVASDTRDLDAQAAHLRLTRAVNVETIATDLATAAGVAEVASRASAREVQSVLFPIGYSTPADSGELLGEELRRVLAVNLESVIALTSALLPQLLDRGTGSIVAFGSIAAARGMGRNVAYAAAKRGLRSYFESLSCLTRGSAVETQLYQLGYVDTQQSFGQRLFPRPVAPARVADHVIRNLGTGSRITYYPRYWRGLAASVQMMPEGLFYRLVR